MNDDEPTPLSTLFAKINTPIKRPSLALQWKGTDACLDFWCACGKSYHFDGYFCYQVQCPVCGRIYGLDTTIRLVELTTEESEILGCLEIMEDDDAEAKP